MIKDNSYKFEVPIGNETLTYYVTGEEMLLSEIKAIKLKGGIFLYKQKIYPNDPTKNKIENTAEQFNIFVERTDNKLDTEPKTWEEYVGQEETKDTIKETLSAIQKDGALPYPHILIAGNAGYGKSALIHLLAKESGLPIVETVAGNLETKEDIYKLLEKLPKTPPYGILFIDEIHGLEKEIGELLLPITQCFTVEGKAIPYFTLAGATTDLGALVVKLSPLVDRCKQKFILRPYTNNELVSIIKNQAVKKKISFTEDALLAIASRSRETPRLALSLLDNIYYYALYHNFTVIDKQQAIDKMTSLRIYEEGITEKDIKLLQYLNTLPKPVGMNALMQVLNIDSLTYQYFIEPYLMRRELMTRTPRGRIITLKGKEYLIKLKE